MKNSFILSLTLLLIGCSSEESLISKAEEFLKSSLNDPSSYQPETFLIVDTTYLIDVQISKCKGELYVAESNIDLKTRLQMIKQELKNDMVASAKEQVDKTYESKFIDGDFVFKETGKKYNESYYMYMKYANEADEEIKAMQLEIDSLNVILKQQEIELDSLMLIDRKKSEVVSISFLATYRAKNAFNALIKSQTEIIYDVNTNTFEIVVE